MSSIVYWLVVCMLVSFSISWLGAVFIEKRKYVDSCSSFECGIDPVGPNRAMFTLHFFLVAVVFVVFDAEILISLPMITISMTNIYWTLWITFLALLFFGLVLEFMLGTIDWNE